MVSALREDQARGHAALSPIVERLAVLSQQLDHLRAIRPRVPGAQALKDDLSLRTTSSTHWSPSVKW